ncbi:MAG: hypothetical protein ACFE7R_04500 [Candidatus Hodarchaeota archaeon]
MKEEMRIKKHEKRLATRMTLLDRESDNQLARELIELHEAKCKECQEDRLGCTVRPQCKDRNFLNTLIELGIESEDLPAFCYSQYLEQLKRFLIEGKGRTIYDRRVPTKDLLSTLRVSSIRHFLSRSKKTWSNTSDVQEDNTILVAGDDLMFQVDFARGVVIINPRRQRIADYKLFRLYVELLSKHYKLEANTSELTSNWWSLTINLSGAKSSQSESLLPDEVLEQFEDFYVCSDDEGFTIEAEVITSGKDRHFEVRDLVELFQAAAKLKPKKTKKSA